MVDFRIRPRAPDRLFRPPRERSPTRSGWLRKAAALLLAVVVLLPCTLILVYRFLPPPMTPLMLIRLGEGEGITKRWVPLTRIARSVPDAVIAAEDNRFCIHHGFDFGAIREALEEREDGGDLRGASTISMQTARNLFLWPARTWLRKGMEAYLTVLLEFLLPKQRIIELYLNIAEWGHGTYGVASASQKYFSKDPSKLTRYEAALLASILPAPREWSANPPGPYVAQRADVILGRISQLGELLDCAH